MKLDRIGIAFAFAAAVLFGASTPLAKMLLADTNPWLLAGLLYLGSGIGLSIVRIVRASRGDALTRSDWPWMAGAVVTGGIAGPVFLMWGLSGTSASAASLLLNAEGVFTALLAWWVFRENFDRRIALGMAAIVSGAVVLSWTGTIAVRSPWPPLAILAACLCWGIDNNLTRKVSLSDPFQISAIKGLVAGATNVFLALLLGANIPSIPTLALSGVVGFLGYGVSLALFVLALRELGTSRAAAYFSTAPFVGAIISVPLLGDTVSFSLVFAGGLMAFGVWLHITENHAHEHKHAAVEHTHAHVHDDKHHQHDHETHPDGSHIHRHRHEPVRHSHSHYPDEHHRHAH
ncbi:DMT family transporter [Varunaivibrio sulfuroxidans]|uniref:Drug/metabolite transporter (DMT)-like permease n=1 Tax=Varunaivibrio sulfuroxidans TaxID=1773489 RepID=A0A4V2UNR1_9PROT|nr:DMT family transporter [Varunaivibrio sulfuroxidans]TCS62121.1 drug/metabolite transporter (DMT)-like permease [Varunaivibrio sulfuroxidans]WES30553.1 DMT family transporter [Varunaivibrio sulfuroxidans]